MQSSLVEGSYLWAKVGASPSGGAWGPSLTARDRRDLQRLCERDRGTDKVAFGKLDAAITQNIVSRRVMKIEVG
jgi:hypothetical protein